MVRDDTAEFEPHSFIDHCPSPTSSRTRPTRLDSNPLPCCIPSPVCAARFPPQTRMKLRRTLKFHSLKRGVSTAPVSIDPILSLSVSAMLSHPPTACLVTTVSFDLSVSLQSC